jgi:hypothetical protein
MEPSGTLEHEVGMILCSRNEQLRIVSTSSSFKEVSRDIFNYTGRESCVGGGKGAELGPGDDSTKSHIGACHQHPHRLLQVPGPGAAERKRFEDVFLFYQITDAALAHILAAETPTAKVRILALNATSIRSPCLFRSLLHIIRTFEQSVCNCRYVCS